MSSKSRFVVKRPEKVVTVVLNASLFAEWEAAEDALRKVNMSAVSDSRLNVASEASVLAERVRTIEDEMNADALHLRLRALTRSGWAEALAAHPVGPEASEADREFGADKAAFFEDVIIRSIVEATQGGEVVEFDPEADWPAIADEITDRQYSDVAQAVFNLNRGVVSVPFSRAASRTNPESSETSK